MGQTLGGGPVTSKQSSDGHSLYHGVSWGVSCMQGWRDSMEDAHLIVPWLEEPGWSDWAVFGVMDGHGGEHVARFCERHLSEEISRGSPDDVEGTLISSFHRMDEMLSDTGRSEELRSLATSPAVVRPWCAAPDAMGCGCTAVVCCLRDDALVVANAGDSRAVLCRGGKAIDLSEDHKPNNSTERDRITKAGGSVETIHLGPMTQYRVNGNLNLSRSIGDLLYKRNPNLPPQEQVICSTPDVRTFARHPRDEFMVIACDGVWDVVSSQEVCDFVRTRVAPSIGVEQRLRNDKLKLSLILESLLDYCLSPDLQETRGIGGDNMTAVLVVFEDRPLQSDDVDIDSPRRSAVNSWCATC